MAITYGLDCSNHQGDMTSLGGVAAQFYCHKLTEGTTYLDPYAERNLRWAKGQGITLRGGYHFIRAGSGAAQADYFIARARALFGHDLRGHLWQLDCESDASYADIKAFKQRWDSETGSVPIMFYTGDWWLDTPSRGWNVAALGFAGLWAAPNRGYVGKAQNVKVADWTAGYGGFSTVTILQYDARDAVGDTNQYRGSLAQLQALLAGDTEEDNMDQHQFNELLRGADIIPIHTGRTEKNPDFSLPSAVEWSYEGIKQNRALLKLLIAQTNPKAFAAELAPLLQAEGPVSQDMVEAAFRKVLGSLDEK